MPLPALPLPTTLPESANDTLTLTPILTLRGTAFKLERNPGDAVQMQCGAP